MYVLLATNSLVAVENLEIALIEEFGGTPGCRNVRAGGDGGLSRRFPGAFRFYTYVVMATADQPRWVE